MKRTQHITLGLLAGMALAFTTGCHRTPERRDCVDETGTISWDQNCQTAEERRHNGYIGPQRYFHWMYGGSSGGHYGDRVFGGNPMPGMSSGSGSGFFGSIGRGGFGSTAGGGHGGSGGE